MIRGSFVGATAHFDGSALTALDSSSIAFSSISGAIDHLSLSKGHVSATSDVDSESRFNVIESASVTRRTRSVSSGQNRFFINIEFLNYQLLANVPLRYEGITKKSSGFLLKSQLSETSCLSAAPVNPSKGNEALPGHRISLVQCEMTYFLGSVPVCGITSLSGQKDGCRHCSVKLLRR